MAGVDRLQAPVANARNPADRPADIEEWAARLAEELETSTVTRRGQDVSRPGLPTG